MFLGSPSHVAYHASFVILNENMKWINLNAATYPVGRAAVDVCALLDDVLHGLGGARAVVGDPVHDQVVQDGLVADWGTKN